MYGRHGQGASFGLEGKKLSGANAHFAKVAEAMKAEREAKKNKGLMGLFRKVASKMK